MEIYKDQISEIRSSLEHQLKLYVKEYESYPSGRLTHTRQGNNIRYFNAQTIDDKYIRKGITSDRTKVAQLARKELLKNLIGKIDCNIHLLNNTLSRFETFDVENTISSMKGAYKTLPADWFCQNYICASAPGADRAAAENDAALLMLSNDSDKAAADRLNSLKNWAEQPYQTSTYRTNEKNKCTSRGLRMRSKSEVMIAELLYQYDIPFRYEQVLYLEGKEFAPDFTFRSYSHSLFFWEYCGMMNDPDYVQKHQWKKQIYERNGIVPWENIFYTYETDGKINLKAMRHFIEDYIIPKL